MTGCPKADFDKMLALGLQAEGSIESRDTVHMAERNAQSFSHVDQGFLGQIVILVLDVFQYAE